VTLTWDHHGHIPLAQTERRPATTATGAAAHTGQQEIDRRFYAMVTDLAGAPTHLLTDTGETAWTATTTLWGHTRTSGTAAATPLRFPGQYADEETGWHYNYHRHYDPETGRFESQDPLGLAPAPDPYRYAHNPLALIDPLGLEGETANPNDINFSQRTISPNDYVDDMVNDNWDWDRSGPLRVTERDGQLVSYDNRRLDAAREAGLTEVPIERLDPNAPDPSSTSGRTWDESFRRRFADPRNRRAGGVVPNTGLSERPGNPPTHPGGRRT
jgi:RHS repeat-associated protein